MTDQPTSTVPTTTAEQNRVTESQRKVNLIWERTQAGIAIAVIGATLIVDGRMAMWDTVITTGPSSALMQLNVMAALVTGFYFGRTNHTRAGGVETDRTR